MNNSYMPKSKSDTHLTPDRVYDMIKENWGYSKDDMFDPCPEDSLFDGLNYNKLDWQKINYVNPPYTLLREFVKRAIDETVLGNKTIMLLPSKTDQEWYHNLIDLKFEIVWIRRRLKFKNNKWSATQPHFLVLIQ